MALQKEFYLTRTDGVSLYRTYSDLGNKIKQLNTGFIFDEAIDTETTENIYAETAEALADN